MTEVDTHWTVSLSTCSWLLLHLSSCIYTRREGKQRSGSLQKAVYVHNYVYICQLVHESCTISAVTINRLVLWCSFINSYIHCTSASERVGLQQYPSLALNSQQAWVVRADPPLHQGHSELGSGAELPCFESCIVAVE